MKRRMAGWISVALLGVMAAGGEEPARLAMDLHEEGQHEAAAVEFRRLALSSQPTNAMANWYWLAAHEYALSAKWAWSDRMLDRAEDAAPSALPIPVSWLRAENALHEKDWNAAAFHFDSLRLKADHDDMRDFAARGGAAARLRSKNIEKALQALAASPGQLEAAQEALNRYAQGRDKKPWVGGVLGLLPGLGYIYSGEYANAARSILLNSLFIWGMVETAEDDEWGLFALVTFGELTWYSGSIYGGIDYAHRYNQRRLDQAVDAIRGDKRLQPDLSRVPLITLKFKL